MSRNWKFVVEDMQISVDFTSFLSIRWTLALMRISSLADHYGMNSKQLETQYKNRLSDFRDWNRLPLAEYWFLFENNIGYYVGMDGTSLPSGDLYTILINKEAKGKRDSHSLDQRDMC